MLSSNIIKYVKEVIITSNINNNNMQLNNLH